MVGIVSGNGTGLNLASNANWGQRGNLGESASNKAGEKQYVNIANGNLILADKDHVLVSKGLDASIVRTYNSQGVFSDDNGDGWWVNGYRRIVNLTGNVNTSGSTIQRVASDNSVLSFEYDSVSQSYVAQSNNGQHENLRFDSVNSEWTWTDEATHQTETYAASSNIWRLSTSKDADGNTTSYQYNGNYLSAIISASNDRIEFAYDGINLSSERVILADGTIANTTYYRYDSQNRLIQAKLDLTPGDNSWSDGKAYVTNYSYLGNTNLVTSVTQTDGSQLSFTYVNLQGQNRVATVTDSLGHTTRFQYDLTNRITTVTDALGNQNSYSYDSQNRLIKVQGPSVAGQSNAVTYEYDGAGNLIRQLASDASSVEYSYDNAGNLSRVKNSDQQQSFSYDTRRQMLTNTITDQYGNAATTRMVYDDQFHLRFSIDAEGRVSEYRYDYLGQKQSSLLYLQNRFDLSGFNPEQSLNLSQLQSWVAQQNPQQVSRTDYQYDSRGQLSQTTQYNKLDSTGLGITDGSESKLRYTYDALGNLLFKIDANNQQTSYTYDGLHRVLSSTDAIGQSTVFEYDDARHVITTRLANGRSDTAIYDSTGQLISNIKAGEAQTEYRYDALGRLVLSIDPTGLKQLYFYDERGNLEGSLDDLGRITEYRYTRTGQRSQTIQRSSSLSPAQLQQLMGAAKLNSAATALPAQIKPAELAVWDNATAYRTGQQVNYLGRVYQARFDHSGAEPANSNAWLEVVAAGKVADWSPTQTYLEGETVQLGGQVFVARWTTTAYQPGVHYSWAQVPPAGTNPPWMAGVAYEAGQIVEHDGQKWRANWSTCGDQPGVHYAWSQVQPAGSNPPWSAGVQYQQNEVVDYNGQHWKARWPSFGDIPGETQVWAQAPDAGTYAPWGAGVTYEGGETIKYQGRLWLAQWFNRAEEPGVSASGVWADQGPAPADPLPANTQDTVSLRSLIKETAQDRQSFNFYSPSGRLLKAVNAEGFVTEFEYDNAGHVLSTTRRAKPVNLSTLTADTKPEQVVTENDTGDRVQRFWYDASGQLIATLDAENYLTQYRLDNAGRRVEQIRYARAVNVNVTSASQLAQILPASDSADQHSYVIYDAKGLQIGLVDAEGYLTEQSYDANGNLTETIRYAKRVQTVFNASSQIEQIRPQTDAADQITRQSYDALNRLKEVINHEGTIKRFEYDVAGNLSRVSEAVGSADLRQSNQRFDQLGRLVAVLGANGTALLNGQQTTEQVEQIWQNYATRYSYDQAGRRTSMTDANGARTLWYYDHAGNLRLTINSLGEVQERNYDEFNQLISTRTYTQRLTAFAELKGGLLNQTEDSLQQQLSQLAQSQDTVQQMKYDHLGQLLEISDGSTQTSRYSYDGFGERISASQMIDANHEVKQLTSFDKRGLQIAQLNDATGIAQQVSQEFDAFGRVVRSVDANGQVRTLSYDLIGRVITSTDPLLAKRSLSYDAFGRILTQTDGNGASSSYRYDAQQRSVTVTTAEGVSITTMSNRHGQVQKLIDGNGNVSEFSYDAEGGLISKSDFAGTSKTIYDKAHRIAETIDANGNHIRYEYDAANRILSRTLDNQGQTQTTLYEYDGKGQQVKTTDANGNISLTSYDKNGRVLTQTQDPAGLKLVTRYEYDGTGKVLSVTSPGGSTVRYTYDSAGRRIAETAGSGTATSTISYSYDSNNNLIKVTDGNGAISRNAYDANNRLVFQISALGNVVEQSYDAEGRVTAVRRYARALAPEQLERATDLAAIRGFVRSTSDDQLEYRVYDKSGHITHRISGLGAVTTMTYDANGNVLSQRRYANLIDVKKLVPGQAPQVVEDNAADQLTQNLYDGSNRLIWQLSPDRRLSHYRYDANGNVLESVSYARRLDSLQSFTDADLSTAATKLADSAHDVIQRNRYDQANRLQFSVDGNGSVTQFVYDANGNAQKQIRYAKTIAASAEPASVKPDENDRVNLMYYDNANRLSYTVQADGAVTKLVRDANGQITQEIKYATPVAPPLRDTQLSLQQLQQQLRLSTDDRVSYQVYDSAKRLIFKVNSDGAITEYRYDGNGQVISEINYAQSPYKQAPFAIDGEVSIRQDLKNDAKDRVSHFLRDAAGRVLYKVNSNGVVDAYDYDSFGQIKNLKRSNRALVLSSEQSLDQIAKAVKQSTYSLLTSYQYDLEGRVTQKETAAIQGVEKYVYDGLGNRRQYIDQAGNVWRYQYDKAGRVVTETSPAVLTYAVYGVDNKLALGQNGLNNIVKRFVYDAMGNLISLTEAEGLPEQRQTFYDYDTSGRRIASKTYNKSGPNDKNPIEVVSTISYNAFGEISAQRDAAGFTSYQSYDHAGRPSYKIDALGFVTAYQYNRFGETTKETRYAEAINLASLAGNSTNAAIEGQLASQGHDKDRSTLRRYDQAGRLIEVQQEATWVTTGLPGAASVLAASTQRFKYDVLGQLIETAQLLDAKTDSWSRTRFAYNERGQKVATLNELNYLTRYRYDDSGNLANVLEFAEALSASDSLLFANYQAPTGKKDREVSYSYDVLNRKISESKTLNLRDINGRDYQTYSTISYKYDALGNIVETRDNFDTVNTNHYDSLGRLESSERRANGISGNAMIRYQRDALGNVIENRELAGWQSDDRNDRISLAMYDSQGNVIQSQDANGNNRFASYDKRNQVIKEWQTVTNADGVKTLSYKRFEYDALGRQIAVITPESNASLANGSRFVELNTSNNLPEQVDKRNYNAFGEIVQRSKAGMIEQFDYDKAGRLWRSNAENGIWQVFQYNLQGQISASYQSTGDATAAANQGNGEILAKLDQARQAEQIQGLRTTYQQYDGLGRMTRQFGPERNGQRSDIKQGFDRWGNLTSRSDLFGYGGITLYEYDQRNHLIRQRNPDKNGQQSADSAVLEYFYDGAGNKVAERDANGNLNQWGYDNLGRLTNSLAADGSKKTYAYTNFGQLEQSKDDRGVSTTYQYDKNGQVIAIYAPVGLTASVLNANVLSIANVATTQTRRYDEAGHMIEQRNGDGSQQKFDYDNRGQLIRSWRSNRNGQVYQPEQQQIYNSAGKVLAQLDANGNSKRWTYNERGQIASSTDLAGATTNYRYDSAGQLSLQTSSAGQRISYRYDNAGQVTQIHDEALNKYTLYSYNLAGQHVREQTIQADYSLQDNWLAYDAQGRLARLDAAEDGYIALYDYDKQGNLIHEREVQQAKANGNSQRDQALDGQVHRLVHLDLQAQASTRDRYHSYDSLNRQTAINQAQAAIGKLPDNRDGHLLTYDKQGNVSSDLYWDKQIVRVIPRDSQGRLLLQQARFEVKEGFLLHQYRYDDSNRLIDVVLANFDDKGEIIRDTSVEALRIDFRGYDLAGRVVSQGLNRDMDSAYLAAVRQHPELGFKQTINIYDERGNLSESREYDANSQQLRQTRYTSYDAMGQRLAWESNDAEGNQIKVRLEQKLGRGYLQSKAVTDYSNTRWGSLNSHSEQNSSYDVNGYLIRQMQSQSGSSGTKVSVTQQVNDADGKALLSDTDFNQTSYTRLRGQVMHSLSGKDPYPGPLFGSNEGRSNNVAGLRMSAFAASEMLTQPAATEALAFDDSTMDAEPGFAFASPLMMRMAFSDGELVPELPEDRFPGNDSNNGGTGVPSPYPDRPGNETNPPDTTPPVVTNPSDPTPSDVTHPHDQTPIDRTPPVVTNPPDTTPPVVNNPPDTTPPVVNNPPDTTPPVVTNPPDTTPPVVNNPPDTTPPVVNNPPDTTPPVVNNPPDTTPPVVNNPPDTTPPVVNNPPDTTPPVVNNPPAPSGPSAAELKNADDLRLHHSMILNSVVDSDGHFLNAIQGYQNTALSADVSNSAARNGAVADSSKEYYLGTWNNGPLAGFLVGNGQMMMAPGFKIDAPDSNMAPIGLGEDYTRPDTDRPNLSNGDNMTSRGIGNGLIYGWNMSGDENNGKGSSGDESDDDEIKKVKWTFFNYPGKYVETGNGRDYPAGYLSDSTTYSTGYFSRDDGAKIPAIQTSDGRVIFYPLVTKVNPVATVSADAVANFNLQTQPNQGAYADSNWNLGTRALGGLQTAGGLAGVATSSALIAAGLALSGPVGWATLGVGLVGAVVNMDQVMTGVATTATGQPIQSQTAKIVQNVLGVSSEAAEAIASILSISPSVAEAQILATTPKTIAEVEREIAKTGQAASSPDQFNEMNGTGKAVEDFRDTSKASDIIDGVITIDEFSTAHTSLADALKFRQRTLELGYDAARDQMLVREGIGAARFENATGRTVTRTVDGAVDFHDSVLGNFDLKGPILANDGTAVAITAERVQGLAKSVIKEANFSTASKAVVVDTMGMTSEQIATLKATVANGVNSTKPIIYIH